MGGALGGNVVQRLLLRLRTPASTWDRSPMGDSLVRIVIPSSHGEKSSRTTSHRMIKKQQASQLVANLFWIGHWSHHPMHA